MKGLKGQQHRSPSHVRRYRGAAPSLGAALELRNLLPDLVAQTTHQKPCVACGGPMPLSPKSKVRCSACGPKRTIAGVALSGPEATRRLKRHE